MGDNEISSASLCGRRVLVTGGARRIGGAISLALGERGARVVVHYYKSRQEVVKIVEAIRKLGSEAVMLQADLSKEDEVERLALEASNVFGGLDVLINNASEYSEPSLVKGAHGLLVECFDDWNNAMAVNAKAPFFLTKLLAPVLRKGTYPCIINMHDALASNSMDSSEVGMPLMRGMLSRASYSISKSALSAFTQIASRTLAPDIRVYGLELEAVMPGDAMSDEEKAKKNWVGTEVVINEVLRCILQRPTALIN